MAIDKRIEPKDKTITIEMMYNKDRVEVECPICKEGSWEYLDEIRKPIVDSRLCICKNCGFVSYNPQLKDLEGFYNRNKRKQTANFIKTKTNKLNYHQKYIFKYLFDNKIKIESFLDYGCSDGYFIKALSDFVRDKDGEIVDAYGIEPNTWHMNWGKYISNLDVTDNTDMDKYKDLDLVSLYHVIEHIQEPDILMKKIYDSMKLGGILYMAVPTMDKVSYNSLGEYFKDEHINLFTDDLLISWLKTFGFYTEVFAPHSYGTVIIAKKTDHHKPVNNFYKETKELIEKVSEMYKLKDKMENAMRTTDIQNAKKYSMEALKVYDVYPELICKAASINEGVDEIDMLLDYTEKYPMMHELWQQLAMCYYKDEDLDKCIETFEYYIENFFGTEAALLQLAYCYMFKGDYSKSLEYTLECYEKFSSRAAEELLFSLMMQM